MTAPAPGTLTRQQLYDKIRETSKDEYILAEMKRLGFWKTDESKPTLPETIIQRRGELDRQLGELLKQQRLYQEPEEALKALRKERMKAALDKRVETARKNADERHQRALLWHEKQQRSISWLGEAVSLGLFAEDEEATAPQMKHQALPVLPDHLSLAEAMGISINELRFLAYQRTTSKVSHYQHFQIAKKTGGHRAISAPMPRLKRVQYWILEHILQTVPLHDAAHGFVAGRSIMTNARPHVGREVVVNLDLQNFFPTISYRRVKGIFRKMGYNEPVATVLGLLCCEPDTQQVELDGERWFVQQGEARLPQGAPTSPALSNIICRSLDIRLQGLADRNGFSYTRYADDMTFSCDHAAQPAMRKLLWGVRAIVAEEGFVLHPDKTRIMHRGRQQEVTGLVVNDRLSVDRKTLRRFRALLHQIEQGGLAGKSWNDVSEPAQLLRSILGFANFVAMVLPEKGALLKQRAKAIHKQYGGTGIGTQVSFYGQVRKAEFRRLSVAGKAPLANWSQAQATNPPIREKTAAELKGERQQMLTQRRQDQHQQQQESSYDDYEDDLEDDEDIQLLRLPKLATLGILNDELSTSSQYMSRIGAMQWIRILLFDRKQLKRVGMGMVKADMLIDDTDFAEQVLTDKPYTLRQINRFNKTMQKVYTSQRTSCVSSIIFYFGAALLLNSWYGWQVFPTILIIMGVFKGSKFFATQQNLKKLRLWNIAATSYVNHYAGQDENETAAPDDEYSGTDAFHDVLRMQAHQLEQEKQDWTVRLFDFVTRLFKRK